MSNLFDYKHEMSALQFTPAQKAQLVRSTAAAAAQKHPRKHRRPIFRTAVIAAAMAVALVAGSSAAGILPAPADVFAPLFGGTVAQTEVIDKIGHPIGASASSNGITITADAIIGDQYNACVVYTITREDGEPFEYEPNEWGYLGLVFEEGWIDIANTHGGSRNIGYHGSSGFIDPTPGDNSIQYFQQISSDTPLNTGDRISTADQPVRRPPPPPLQEQPKEAVPEPRMPRRVEAIRTAEGPERRPPLQRPEAIRRIEEHQETPAPPPAPAEVERRPTPEPIPSSTSQKSPVSAQGKSIQVMLNGQSLILPGKEDGVPYYVMDLLEHSGIDFDNLDRGVELQVNGSNCSFTQELKARDDVVIRYLEK